ncbi:MAG: RDD family protein [Vicinamibacterales bacterium]
MKCPKCGYLGFEPADRCRNCQYDFSLTSPSPVPDFTIRRDTEIANPFEDLALIDAASQRPSTPANADRVPDLDRIFGAPEPDSRPLPPSAVADALKAFPREELPLFGPPIPDDEPLITKASPPRQPLAVRRATPESPRPRVEPQLRTPSFDLALEVVDPSPMPVVLPADRTTSVVWSDEQQPQDAGIGARLFAVIVDLLILTVVDVVVIYFTMQLCYLSIDDLWILPKGPLLAFLLVQNGGYLVAFTASGQTLGKMIAGIRVVQSDTDASLDLGRAFLRTMMWAVLAVPAGLGFLTALFSRDHRGLHDRFAGTRVIRASV